MAQLGLGARHNRSKALRELGSMSYSVARAVVERSDNQIEGDPELFLRAVCTPDGTVLSEEPIDLVERPPLAAL